MPSESCRRTRRRTENHDAVTLKIQEEFRWWKQLAEITVGVQRIVLCHYAMRVWHHCGHGAWQLYGHSHGRLPEAPAMLSMDVGVDTHDFRPWHFDEIKAAMEARQRIASELVASEASDK